MHLLEKPRKREKWWGVSEIIIIIIIIKTRGAPGRNQRPSS
jgi:hypothetical protein